MVFIHNGIDQAMNQFNGPVLRINLLDIIRSLTAYQQVLSSLKSGRSVASLGLMRQARLPMLAALHLDLNIPLMLITDRSDRALTIR